MHLNYAHWMIGPNPAKREIVSDLRTEVRTISGPPTSKRSEKQGQIIRFVCEELSSLGLRKGPAYLAFRGRCAIGEKGSSTERPGSPWQAGSRPALLPSFHRRAQQGTNCMQDSDTRHVETDCVVVGVVSLLSRRRTQPLVR